MADAVVKDGRVYMRDDAGRAFSVPEAEARKELQAGARLESPDEFHSRMVSQERGTVGQQALTALEGAAGITGGGATLGLAAPIAEAIGGREYIDAAREREETNPIARTVGDIGGAVAPALLSGGTGAIGAAARLTPAGMAARAGLGVERAVGGLLGGAAGSVLGSAARLGAAGAAEGAAYGLGGSLAKSVLEDTAWTADRALAGLREGALYGLAGGAGVGAAGALGGKVVKGMLGGRTLKEAAESYAEKRAVSATVGDDARTVARLTDDGANPRKLKEAAYWIRERGIPVADHPAAVRALKVARVADAQAAQAAAGQLDALGAALSAERRTALADTLGDIAKSGRQGKAVARTLGKGLDGAATFSDAAELLGTLDNAAAKAADTPLEAQIQALRSRLSAGLTEAAEVASPEAAGAWASAARSHEIASALHEGAKVHAGRLANQASTPFADMGGSLLGALAGVATGSIGVGAITGVLGGIAQGAARKMIQERGASALLKIADRVASTTARIDGAAKHLAGLKGAPAIASAATFGGDFSSVAGALAETMQSPEALHAKIEKTIAPIAQQQPEVAMMMAKQIAGDYAWLQTKVPAALGNAQSLTPQAEPRPLPKLQKEKLVNYARALADPVSVLEGMSKGRVDWDGIEALKARRPELWADMRSSVQFACAQAGEQLPYRRRVMLSLAFEFQGDPSLGNVSGIQASGQMPPPSTPPGAAPSAAPAVRAPAISSAAEDTEIRPAVGAAA